MPKPTPKNKTRISGGDGSEIALDVTSSPAQFRAGVLALGYLLADKLIISKTVLPYAATVNLNFGRSFQTVALTGNVVFTTAGLTDGLHAFIKVTSDGTLRTLTFPAGWKFVGGAAPANIAANKTAMLELWCTGNADSDVTARWTVQP